MACSFQSFTHVLGLLKNLNFQREKGHFCDCVIRLQLDPGKLYLAHRNILAASSPVLASLLSNLGTLLDLQHPSLTPETLTLLLEFIYTGTLPPPGLEDSLYPAATYLEMEELQHALNYRRSISSESSKNMETGENASDKQGGFPVSPSKERNVKDLCVCKGLEWPCLSAPRREGVPVIRHTGVTENIEDPLLCLEIHPRCTKQYLVCDDVGGKGADCMPRMLPGWSSSQYLKTSGSQGPNGVSHAGTKKDTASETLHQQPVGTRESKEPVLQCTGKTVIAAVVCPETDNVHSYKADWTPITQSKETEDSGEDTSVPDCIRHEILPNRGGIDAAQTNNMFTSHWQSFEDKKCNLIGDRAYLGSCPEISSDTNQISVVKSKPTRKTISLDPEPANSRAGNTEASSKILKVDSSAESIFFRDVMVIGNSDKEKDILSVFQLQKMDLPVYQGRVTYHCLESGQEFDSEGGGVCVHEVDPTVDAKEVSAMNSPVSSLVDMSRKRLTVGPCVSIENAEVFGDSTAPAQPYQCGMCERAFSQRGSLNRHLRSHLGVRPYPCPRCPMTFSRQYRVQEHLRVHQRSCERLQKTDPT